MSEKKVTVIASEIDVDLLQRLSDCAMRAGEYQTAIAGYALVLKLLNESRKWREIAEMMP